MAKEKPKRRGKRQVAISTAADDTAADTLSAPEPAPASEPAPVPELAVAEQAPVVVAAPVLVEEEPRVAPAPREVVISNPAAYVYVDQVDPAQPKKAGWWSKR